MQLCKRVCSQPWQCECVCMRRRVCGSVCVYIRVRLYLRVAVVVADRVFVRLVFAIVSVCAREWLWQTGCLCDSG